MVFSCAELVVRQEKGWEPGAVTNWLALTGWNLRRHSDTFHDHEHHKSLAETNKVPEDVMTLAQLTEAVSPAYLVILCLTYTNLLLSLTSHT